MALTQSPVDGTAVKKLPAPGASPVGGTTSLPQYLQPPKSPTDGSGIQGPTTAAPTQNAPPALAAPVPSSTQPGTVPPSPPVATPAPAGGGNIPASNVPGTESTGRNTEMGDKLFEELMKMLKESSRYGSEQAGKTREQGIGRLQDEQKLGEQRAIADAAKRGVYYGTPLTNSLGDLGERYQRGLGDLETNIQRDQAQRAMEDKQRVIEMIFGYGDRQNRDTQQQNDLWLKLLEAGLIGGPTIPGAVGDMPNVGI
jgi:hypothetical protein